MTKRNGFEEATAAVEKALEYDVTDADSLMNLHRSIYGNVCHMSPIRLSEGIPKLPQVAPDFSVYDSGLGKAGER